MTTPKTPKTFEDLEEGDRVLTAYWDGKSTNWESATVLCVYTKDEIEVSIDSVGCGWFLREPDEVIVDLSNIEIKNGVATELC